MGYYVPDHAKVIETALGPFIRNGGNRENARDAVYAALDGAGAVLDGTPVTVEVAGARVPVETVEVYGLVIRLDANGRAASIHHPEGLEVTEYQVVAA
jgi:hypothetical protein